MKQREISHKKRGQRLAFGLGCWGAAGLLCLCNTGGYKIQQPVADTVFSTGSGVGGLGTGPASGGYSFSVRRNGVNLNQVTGMVSSGGVWGSTVSPPADGWGTGEATARVFGMDNTSDTAFIEFVDP